MIQHAPTPDQARRRCNTTVTGYLTQVMSMDWCENPVE